ncbi:hypothetical protein BDF20DRAFT_859215 [Mycotypha africana]|uniref:uncharacterized protein n=1 Tax=Mycotypha africana TaxID=64632 RepID=UPI00230152A7|nr:uncharacterized protein BDF20DRAFT_859215 [Mycotypha africana]KAI8984314.1 hypothetical protein BDF20DRAFT_859215 [Mycotypha africana]
MNMLNRIQFSNLLAFYSYLHDAPNVIFGALNLLFGIVTVCSMAVFLIRANTINKMMRMQFGPVVRTFSASPTIVFIITANALGVLIAAIVNFVLFVEDKDGFNKWCIEMGVDQVQTAFASNNHMNGTDGTLNNLSNALRTANNLYNCNRLFEDEMKWALFCTIVMIVIYTHWILIIAAKQSYSFYRRAPVLSLNEFGNIAPSATNQDKKKMSILRNSRPTKSFLEQFLVHKQYDEFCKNELHDKSIHEDNIDSSLGMKTIKPPEKVMLP